MSAISSLSLWSSIKIPIFVYAGGRRKAVDLREEVKKVDTRKPVTEMVNLRVPGEEKENTIPYHCCTSIPRESQPPPQNHLNRLKNLRRRKKLRKISLVTVPEIEEPEESSSTSQTSLKLHLKEFNYDCEKIKKNVAGSRIPSIPTVKRLSLKELEEVNRKCFMMAEKIPEKEKKGRKSSGEHKGKSRKFHLDTNRNYRL